MAKSDRPVAKPVSIPVPSSFHFFEVRLHRIARLYDVGTYDYPELMKGLHTGVSATQHKMVFEGWESAEISTKAREEGPDPILRQFDESAEDLKKEDIELLKPHQDARNRQQRAKRYDGLSCTFSRPARGAEWGEYPVGRTFVREDSRPVSGFGNPGPTGNYWVYVFQSSDPEGIEQIYLLSELEFAGDPPDASGKGKLKYGDANKFRRMPIPKPMSLADIAEKTRSMQPPGQQSGTRPDEPLREIPQTAQWESVLKLLVEMVHPQKGWVQAHYFFYLARWQLPWDGILKVAKDLRNRTVRLGDFFYTDVAPQKTSAKVPPGNVFEPLLPKPTTEKRDLKKLAPELAVGTYLLHLVDPFEEAQVRATAYHNALELVKKLLPDRSTEPEYAYAKGIELLLMKASAAQRSIVEKKLNGYLYPCGKDIVGRAWAITGILLEQLIDWIGRPRRREIYEAYWQPFIVFAYDMSAVRYVIDETTLDPTEDVHSRYQHAIHCDPQLYSHRPEIPKQKWSNPFSEAVECYYDAPEEEVRRLVGNTICAVQIDLPAMPQGQAWLCQNLEAALLQLRGVAEKQTDKDMRKKLEEVFLKRDPNAESLIPKRKPLGDKMYGGLQFFFQLNKGWQKDGAKATMKAAHLIYACGWARIKGDKAISSLNQLLNIAFKLNINELQTYLGVQRKYDVSGNATLTFDPQDALKSPAKMLEKSFGALCDTISFFNAIDDLRKHSKNPKRWLKASADLMKALASSREAKDMMQVMRGIPGATAQIQGLSGMWLGARIILVATGMMDVFESPDNGVATGRAVKLMGTTLAWSTSTGGVGLVVVVAGVILQFAGEWIAFEYSDITQFLRGCRFADHENRRGHLLGPQKRDPEEAEHVTQSQPALAKWDRGEFYKDLWKKGLAVEQHAFEDLIYECRMGLYVDEGELQSNMQPTQHINADLVSLVLTPYYWHCYTTGYNIVADIKMRLSFVEINVEAGSRPGTLNPIYFSSEISIKTSPDALKAVDDDASEEQLFRISLGRPLGSSLVTRFPTILHSEQASWNPNATLEGHVYVTGSITLSLEQGLNGMPTEFVTPIELRCVLTSRFGRLDRPR